MMWGKYCNQTVEQFSCVESYNLTKTPRDANSSNLTTESITSCGNADEKSCSGDNEPKIFSLDVMGIAQQISFTATDIIFNQTQPSNFSSNSSRVILMCYARHGAMPLPTLHDYSGNINNAPLVIHSPKVGRWYISVQPVNLTDAIGGIQDSVIKLCYSLDSQVLQCPVDKAGLNCTSEKYELQVSDTLIGKSYFVSGVILRFFTLKLKVRLFICIIQHHMWFEIIEVEDGIPIQMQHYGLASCYENLHENEIVDILQNTKKISNIKMVYINLYC